MVEPEEEKPQQQRQGVERRTFVRGAVASAALGAAAASGIGIFRQFVPSPDVRVRYVPYVGTWRHVKSPAPRGLPYIPVRVNDEGSVEGVPELDGDNHLDWLRYCGHETDRGLLVDGTQDNVFRYFLAEEAILTASPEQQKAWAWYKGRVGEKVSVADFAALPHGTAAKVRWRSEGVPLGETATALLFKIDPADVRGPARKELLKLMDRDHHLLAVSTFCTHLCCVPGYKETDQARRLDAWDFIYCTCHGSRFDPLRAERFSFELREPIEA